MNNALVVGSGAMYGAYGAGVLRVLAELLGSKFFDRIYASSVGALNGTFFAAGRPDICEEIWRNYVHGRRLVNLFRIWNIFNLKYLERLSQSEKLFLDIGEIFRSRCRLTYVLTRLEDGKTVYQEPNPRNILECVRASATPPLHRAVLVDDEMYIDGGLSDPLPVAQALKDGARLVVAVSNKWEDFRVPRLFHILGAAYGIVSKSVSRLIYNYQLRIRETEKYLRDPRVVVIRPSSPLSLRSSIDTNHARINDAIDRGKADARAAMEHLRRQCDY